MSHKFMRTIGAIKNIEKIGDEAHIKLYKIADVTNFFRLCFASDKVDMAIAAAIKQEKTFSGTINKARMTLEIIIHIPESTTFIEFYEEGNKENSKKFYLN